MIDRLDFLNLLSAALHVGVGLAYVGLGTVRFRVATEAVLRYAHKLGVPHELPTWLPDVMRRHFTKGFRLAVSIFFLGCAFTHFELAAHGLAGDLPEDYVTAFHLIVMALQGIGAWLFVGVLSLVDQALRRLSPDRDPLWR